MTTLVYIQPRDEYDVRKKLADAASMVKTIQAIKASAAAATSAAEETARGATDPKVLEYYYMLTQPSATDIRDYTDQVLTVMIDEGRHNFHHSRCTHPECPGWEKAKTVRVLEERLRNLPAREEGKSAWTCNPSAVQLNQRSGDGAIDTANPFYTFFERVQGEAWSRGECWPPGPRDQWDAESEDKFMAKLKSLHKHKPNSTRIPSRWRQWQADTDLVSDRRSAPPPLAGIPIVPSSCADRWHHRFCDSVLCPGSATKEEAKKWAVRPRTPPLRSGSRTQGRGGKSDSEPTVWGDESDNALESGSGSETDEAPEKRRRRTAKSHAVQQPKLRERMADSRGWGTRCRPDLSFPWMRYDDSLDAVGTFRSLPSTLMDEALAQRPDPVGEGAARPFRLMRYLGDDGYNPDTLREFGRSAWRSACEEDTKQKNKAEESQ